MTEQEAKELQSRIMKARQAVNDAKATPQDNRKIDEEVAKQLATMFVNLNEIDGGKTLTPEKFKQTFENFVAIIAQGKIIWRVENLDEKTAKALRKARLEQLGEIAERHLSLNGDLFVACLKNEKGEIFFSLEYGSGKLDRFGNVIEADTTEFSTFASVRGNDVYLSKKYEIGKEIVFSFVDKDGKEITLDEDETKFLKERIKIKNEVFTDYLPVAYFTNFADATTDLQYSTEMVLTLGELISDIPEEWKVSRLKYIFNTLINPDQQNDLQKGIKDKRVLKMTSIDSDLGDPFSVLDPKTQAQILLDIVEQFMSLTLFLSGIPVPAGSDFKTNKTNISEATRNEIANEKIDRKVRQRERDIANLLKILYFQQNSYDADYDVEIELIRSSQDQAKFNLIDKTLAEIEELKARADEEESFVQTPNKNIEGGENVPK